MTNKFLATLVGETDGYEVGPKLFESRDAAVKWCCGLGLADFDDQTARGTVVDGDTGLPIWTKSGLQTPDKAQRTGKLEAHRFLASLGFDFNKRR